MKINQIQALDFDIAYMDDAGYTCHKNIATCCLHLELTLHLGRNVAKTPRFYPCDVFKRCSLQICISEDTSLNEKSSVVAYCNAYELSSIVPQKKTNHQNFGHCSDVFHERWDMAHGVPLQRETARVSHRPLTRERLGPRDHFPILHECHFLPRHMLQLKLMSPHRHSSINVTPNKNKHSHIFTIPGSNSKYIYIYIYIYI